MAGSIPRPAVGTRFRAAARPVGAVFRDRNLRLMELARASALLASSGSTIVFVVLCYRLGGAGGVAALSIARLVVIAVTAPLTSVVGDRYDRRLVVVFGDALRVLVLLGAAATVASKSLSLVIAVAIAVTLTGMVSSPARGALMPTLAGTPERLTAANVVAGATDTIGSFVGPALAGLGLALSRPSGVLLASASVAAASPLFVSRIRPPRDDGAGTTVRRRGLTRETFAGFRAVVATRQMRALLVLCSIVSLVGGALTILFAVTAIRTLGLGSSGVGFLYSFFSGGAVVGSVVSILLIGRSLETGIVLGALVWGLPLMAVGLWPTRGVAYVLFAVGGVGDTVVSVASETLVQRVIPRDVLSRSLGALGFLYTGVGVAGSVLAPVVVSLAGPRGALLAFGAIVPLGALPAGAWLRASARAAPPALEVLREVPIFAPLPPNVLEQLADSVEAVRVPPEGVVFRAGDEGDRFYIVASGEVEISTDGRVLTSESRGGSFGEIALLRERPRTATAVAPEGAELYAIRRQDFVDALTGHTPALEAADALVTQRLAETA